MKNNDISRLRKNYAINFKLGLITALSFTIMAFNFTSVSPKTIAEVEVSDEFKTKEIEVIRTAHKKPLPPPTLELTENFETVEEVTMPDPEEPEPINLSIDDADPEIIFEEGTGGDVDEIEPDVDEAPLDILVEEPVRDFAEYMPSFGNCKANEMSKEEYKQCSDGALLQYFAKNIRYPSVARENGIEGKVVLRFVIDEQGKVQMPKVARGVAGGCSEEALRVLQSMPTWKAGRHGGRNVKVHFTLPVTFKLQH